MFEHHIHIVFGKKNADGLLARNACRQPHQFDPLTRSHAGGRFIHQKQLRMIGERNRQFETLEIAVSQFTARPLCIATDADQFEQPVRLAALKIRRRAPDIENLVGIGNQCHLHVLAHRHGRKRRGDLEGAADPKPPHSARRPAGDIFAEQTHAAAIRRLLAVEHIEACALARAVRADQRDDFAGCDRERNAAHRMHAAVGLCQILNRQQCGCHTHSAPSACEARGNARLKNGRRPLSTRLPKVPAMPLGNATTIRTIMPPSTSFDNSV